MAYSCLSEIISLFEQTYSSGRIEPARPIRGTRDRFGTENIKYSHILKIASSIAELYCYDHVMIYNQSFVD